MVMKYRVNILLFAFLISFISCDTVTSEVEEEVNYQIDAISSATHKSLVKGGYVNDSWIIIYLYNGSLSYQNHLFSYGISTGNDSLKVYTDTTHLIPQGKPLTDTILRVENLLPNTEYNYMFSSYLPGSPDHETILGTFKTTAEPHYNYPNSEKDKIEDMEDMQME